MRSVSILKKFFRYLFFTIIVLAIGLWFLVATPWGTSFSIGILNSTDIVQVEYRSGRLIDKLKLRSLRFVQESITLELKDININWRLSCLFQVKLCIAELQSNALILTINPTISTNENTKATAALEDINLPIAIDLNHFSFSNIQVNIDNNSFRVKEFSGRAFANGHKVSLINPKLKQLNIELSHSSNASITSNTNNTGVQPSEPEEWVLSQLPEIYIPVDFRLTNLSMNDINIVQKSKALKTQTQTQAEVLLQLSSIETSLSAYKNKLILDNLQIVHPTIASLVMKGDINLTKNYPLQLNLIGQINQFPEFDQMNNSKIDLELKGDFSQLDIKLTTLGQLKSSSIGNINLTEALLPFELTVDAEQLPMPAEIDQQLTTGNININVSGNIQQQSLQLNSSIAAFGYQEVDIDALMTHQAQTLTIKKIRLNDNHSQSDLSITGSFSYANGLNWALALATNGFTLPEVVDNLTGRISGHFNHSGNWNNEQWHLAINKTDLRGTINQMPAKITGQIDVNNKFEVLPSDLQISINDSDIAIKGFTDKQWHLLGQVKVNDFTKWEKSISGRANLDFVVKGALAIPKITFEGKINDITIAEMTNQQIDVKAEYQPYKLSSSGQTVLSNQSNIELSIAATKLPQFEIASTKVKLFGNNDTQELSIQSAKKNNQLGINVHLKNQPGSSSNEFISLIENFEIDSPYGKWNLDKSLKITSQPDKLAINFEDHCWNGPETTFCVTHSQLNQQQGDVNINLAINVGEIANQQLKANKILLNSLINGNINLNWSDKKQLEVTSQLTLVKGSLVFEEIEQALEWNTSTLNLSATAKRSTIDLDFRQLERSFLKTHLELDHQQLTIEKSNILIDQFALNQLTGFSPALKSLNGNFNANVELAGQILNPKINGKFSINDANISVVSNPTEINDINVTAQLEDKLAKISGSFKVGKGSANLEGTANWNNQKPELSLDLKGESLTLLYPPDSFAKVSPDLQLSIKNNDISLSGKLAIDDGLVKIEALPKSSLSVSEDIIFVDNDGKTLTEKNSFSTKLDVKLTIADKFKVNAMGFEGKVSGDLAATQIPTKPLQLFGNININEGVYKAYGQDLKVDYGQLIFNGSSKNPHINIRAARHIENENVKAGIQVLGPADQLALTFYSDPSFDQNEILSYIVRGRGLDSKTGSANPVSMLVGTGISSSAKLFKQLESIPFISDIEVDSQGEGDDTQATISGYIDNRIYIKYGIGVFQPINELTTRLYIMNRLWIETVSSLENSVDIYYSFDID